MDNQTKAPGLDIFKLIVALGLFAALVYFYLQDQQASAASEAVPTVVSTIPTVVPEAVEVMTTPTQVEISWPEFPPSEVKLTLDVATGQLITPEGVPVYVVNVAAGQWVPVIPAELQAALPEGAAVVKAEKNWVIVGTDNAQLYTWNSVNLTWVNVSPNNANLKVWWLPLVMKRMTVVLPFVEAAPAVQPTP
jgi:hypothetical protein